MSSADIQKLATGIIFLFLNYLAFIYFILTLEWNDRNHAFSTSLQRHGSVGYCFYGADDKVLIKSLYQLKG